MNYVERLKARLGQVGQVYVNGAPNAPSRPLQVDESVVMVTNQLVDLMVACRIKGIDWHNLADDALGWAEYEWTLAEPLIAKAKAEAAAARPEAA